jgi:hypothetical protein
MEKGTSYELCLSPEMTFGDLMKNFEVWEDLELKKFGVPLIPSEVRIFLRKGNLVLESPSRIIGGYLLFDPIDAKAYEEAQVAKAKAKSEAPAAEGLVKNG